MLSYIENKTISNDPGNIFQNYFVPFICLLKCAEFSGNSLWAASYGAFDQCNHIIKNLVKVPIASFNKFLERFGFLWDTESKKFFKTDFYRDCEITLEGLDIFDDIKKNDAISALLIPIRKNSEILSSKYLSSRASLILNNISNCIRESPNIFGVATLDDILLEYIDRLPEKQDTDFDL